MHLKTLLFGVFLVAVILVIDVESKPAVQSKSDGNDVKPSGGKASGGKPTTKPTSRTVKKKPTTPRTRACEKNCDESQTTKKSTPRIYSRKPTSPRNSTKRTTPMITRKPTSSRNSTRSTPRRFTKRPTTPRITTETIDMTIVNKNTTRFPRRPTKKRYNATTTETPEIETTENNHFTDGESVSEDTEVYETTKKPTFDHNQIPFGLLTNLWNAPTTARPQQPTYGINNPSVDSYHPIDPNYAIDPNQSIDPNNPINPNNPVVSTPHVAITSHVVTSSQVVSTPQVEVASEDTTEGTSDSETEETEEVTEGGETEETTEPSVDDSTEPIPE